jgi:outer membrane protein assembly factor BamB
VVFVASADKKLYAFDAAGARNCSGLPRSCTPLWTGAVGGSVYNSSPVIANGLVYIGADDNELYAFDAGGGSDCSGDPKSCAPLWTATTGGIVSSSPAVAKGVVYVGSRDNNLDAVGVTGCSGAPKTCAPLWKATTDGAVNDPSCRGRRDLCRFG